MADEAVILDNSGDRHVRVMTLERGDIIWCAPMLPSWVEGLAGQI